MEFYIYCKVIYGFDFSRGKTIHCLLILCCMYGWSMDKFERRLWFCFSQREVLVKTTYRREGGGVQKLYLWSTKFFKCSNFFYI